MMKRSLAALLLVACGRFRDQPVGQCRYQLVAATCELRTVDVGEPDTDGYHVHATYAWRGALPPGADSSNSTSVLELRASEAQVETLRARLQAKPEVACQLRYAGACPQTLEISPVEGLYDP